MIDCGSVSFSVMPPCLDSFSLVAFSPANSGTPRTVRGRLSPEMPAHMNQLMPGKAEYKAPERGADAESRRPDSGDEGRDQPGEAGFLICTPLGIGRLSLAQR